MIKNPDTSGYEYKYLTLDVKGAWYGVPLLFWLILSSQDIPPSTYETLLRLN